MPLNFYDWHCCRGNELYDLAIKYNIPIIAQAPMKGGLLTRLGCGSSKFAIDFIRSLDNIEYILTGTSNLVTYKDVLKCLTDPIEYTDSEEWLVKLQTYLTSTKINCIQCSRCYDVCEHDVPVMTLFSLYNKCIDLNSSKRICYFNSLDLLKSNLYGQLELNRCQECKKCNTVCPVGLDIVKILWNDVWEIRT